MSSNAAVVSMVYIELTSFESALKDLSKAKAFERPFKGPVRGL
jgi:hypothetical protein